MGVDAPDGVGVNGVGGAVENQSCGGEKSGGCRAALNTGRRERGRAPPTVLVDEHADGDAAGVEAVQEVLDVLVGDRVLGEHLLVLDDALGHRRDHVVVSVPDGDQGVDEPAEEGQEHTRVLTLLELPQINRLGCVFLFK